MGKITKGPRKPTLAERAVRMSCLEIALAIPRTQTTAAALLADARTIEAYIIGQSDAATEALPSPAVVASQQPKQNAAVGVMPPGQLTEQRSNVVRDIRSTRRKLMGPAMGSE